MIEQREISLNGLKIISMKIAGKNSIFCFGEEKTNSLVSEFSVRQTIKK